MTGLFHRLARQVVGPEPLRARTAARLPFASPPAAEVPQTLAYQTFMPPAAGRIDGDPTAEERRESVLPPPPLMAPAAERREDSPPQRDERRAAPGIATAGHAAPAERREAQGTAPRTEPVLSLPTPPERSAEPPPDRAASVVENRKRLVIAESPATLPPVAAARPEPLLPEVRQPATVDRRAHTPAPERASAAEPATPPEVHVHIGWIEVTSVADRQPSRESAMRRAPAMSLEDYLAKRSGG